MGLGPTMSSSWFLSLHLSGLSGEGQLLVSRTSPC